MSNRAQPIPCPWCGEKPHLYDKPAIPAVECSGRKCPLRFAPRSEGRTLREAIRRWNKRWRG